MIALVKEQTGTGIALRERAVPAPAPAEVLVKVAACGISGSEIGRYLWTGAYHAGRAKDMTTLLPRVMGHEFAGVVAARGDNAKNVEVGDRVVVQSVIGCGGCESCDAGLPNHCRARLTIGVDVDGGFAEYCLVPAANVYAVPDGVSLEAAALLQPFAIGAYATEISAVRPGDRVGVWGVGALGVSIIQHMRIAGATVEFAVGRNRERLQAARALGVNEVVSAQDGDPAAVLAGRFSKRKLDAIFEVSGYTPALNASLPLLKKRGRLILLGNLRNEFRGDLLQMIMDQISILTVRTYSLSAWRRALTLIDRMPSQSPALPVVRMPLNDGVRAFERAAQGEGTKFVLVP